MHTVECARQKTFIPLSLGHRLSPHDLAKLELRICTTRPSGGDLLLNGQFLVNMEYVPLGFAVPGSQLFIKGVSVILI